MTHFSELPLDPTVLQALADMGYEKMTPIQEMAIPKLLTGQDFLGQAPTGTGKTAAFGIPLISRLQPGPQTTDGKMPDALILGPTRELVQQIADELNRIGAVKGVRTMPIFGGENFFGQKETMRRISPQIIAGTPGRVLDHLRQLTLDLTQTRLVILDEADEMLDMGFRPDIEAILKHLPGGRETWLFSATMSSEIRKIADQYMYYPEEVRIQPQTVSAANIRQYFYIVKDDDKPALLRKILKETPDVYGIVFCQTKRDVVLLTRKLRNSFPLDCLHGAMQQSDRDYVMDNFRSGKLKVLVATDIMARGIDVDSLTHIFNYSPPGDPESYIHRIGRTARKGESGIAMTFFTPFEKRALEVLERRVKMTLEKHPDSTIGFEDSPVRSGSGGRSSRRRGGSGDRHRPPSGHPQGHLPSGNTEGSRQQGQAGSPATPDSSAVAEGAETPRKSRRRRPRRKSGNASNPSDHSSTQSSEGFSESARPHETTSAIPT